MKRSQLSSLLVASLRSTAFGSFSRHALDCNSYLENALKTQLHAWKSLLNDIRMSEKSLQKNRPQES